VWSGAQQQNDNDVSKPPTLSKNQAAMLEDPEISYLEKFGVDNKG
jgi:hypothetical protein